MAQIDMPLVVLTDQDADQTQKSAAIEGLARWRAVVATAAEPCMVLDAAGIITALSSAAAELLGGAPVEDFLGCALTSCGVRFVDFTAAASPLPPAELERLAPLASATTAQLARGLVRLRPVGNIADLRTLDIVSSPVLADGEQAGSISFLMRI